MSIPKLVLLMIFLFLLPVVAEEPPFLGIVIATDVNLRSGPGTTHQILGTVQAGDRVRVVEQEGDWGRVSSKKFKAAWVSLRYVKPAWRRVKPAYFASSFPAYLPQQHRGKLKELSKDKGPYGSWPDEPDWPNVSDKTEGPMGLRYVCLPTELPPGFKLVSLSVSHGLGLHYSLEFERGDAKVWVRGGTGGHGAGGRPLKPFDVGTLVLGTVTVARDQFSAEEHLGIDKVFLGGAVPASYPSEEVDENGFSSIGIGFSASKGVSVDEIKAILKSLRLVALRD